MELDSAIDAVVNADPKDRQHAGTVLLAALRDSGSLDGGDAGRLLSSLIDWVKSSNFKIATVGIECVSTIVELAPDSCGAYIGDLAPTLRDKAFSDSKESVRDAGLGLCVDLMAVTTPQEVWDVVSSGLKHRAPRVKEYTLRCFDQAITRYGVKTIRIGPHLSTLGGMVADRDENVREAAASALVEVFRHVGNRLRRDLGRIDGIPAAKMTMLNDRFDAVMASGTMTVTDDHPPATASSSSSRRGISRGMSAGSRKSPSATVVGVSPEEFAEALAYGSTSPAYARTDGQLESEFSDFRKLLSDDRADWERRVQVCRRMRCLMAGDAPTFGSFRELVLDSAPTLAAGVKDLRSQVSKEACITVARFSEVLRVKFEPACKTVIPALFSQCIINTKVLADSAYLALKHVMRTCQSHRVFNHVFESRTHKAVAARKAAFEALQTILTDWEPDVLKKVLTNLSEMLFVGISDADSGVRQIARTSFWHLEGTFPAASATLMSRLDPSKVKLLNKERNADPAPPRQNLSNRQPRKSVSTRKSPEPEPELERRSPPRGGSLNSSGPLRVKASSASVAGRDSGAARMEPQRVRPSTTSTSSSGVGGHGMGTNAELNRSGPRRVAATPASKAVQSSAGSARRVAVKQPLRVREPTVGEHIASASQLCSSNMVEDRIEGCNEMQDLLASGRVGESDASRIAGLTVSQLGSESSSKVVAVLADVLADFIVRFRDIEEPEWICGWTIGLLTKLGEELPYQVHEKVSYTLELLRGSFDTATQVLCLFEILANHSELQLPAAKTAAMAHMEKLLPDYEANAFQDAYSSNALDCLSGIQRMAEFVNAKSSELRRLAANNLLSLFRVDPPMFAEMLSRWPQGSLKMVRKALDIALPSWETELYNRGTSRLTHPASSTEAFDLAVSMDDLGMGLDDELEPEDPADPIGYNPDMYRDFSPAPSSNTYSPEPASIPSPVSNGDAVPVNGPEEYRSEIEIAVESAIASYTNGVRDTPTMLAMLQIFQQASKDEGAIWDVHFDAVLEIVLDLMESDASHQVRDDSLRNLRVMLKAQTRYFGNSIDIVVRKLLERHQETERDVLRSAEETLSVLSNTVAATSCALILKPIIWHEDGAVLLAAIKLLTKILKKLSAAELSPLLEELIPGLIKGYKHPLAEVRKGVVFALVEMHLVLGDALEPHLSELSSSQHKLLGIYIKRAEDKMRDAAV